MFARVTSNRNRTAFTVKQKIRENNEGSTSIFFSKLERKRVIVAQTVCSIFAD
jgi:hypothetical protein